MKNLCELFETTTIEADQTTLDAMTDSELIALLQGNNDVSSVHNILDTIACSESEVSFA